MVAFQIYISILIIVLLTIGVIIFLIRKDKKPLTTLTGLAFAFVISSIAFGDNTLISYSLIVIGVLLAIIDAIIKIKKK